MIRSSRRMGITTLIVLSPIVIGAIGTATAQDVQKPSRQKPSQTAGASGGGAEAATARDPAKAQRSYETGVAAYRAGRHDEAVNALNAAVQSGGLAGPAMAKALYYRGAAFQAKGMPGQAISDLTSALWFKGGLDDQERAEATRIRGEAYRAAGLNDQGVAPTAATALTAGPVDDAPASPRLSALPGDQQDGTSSSAIGELGNVLGGLFGGLTSGPKPVETGSLQGDPGAGAPAQPVTSSAGARGGGEPEVLPWGAVATRVDTITPRAAPEKAAPAAATPKSTPAPKPAAVAAVKPPAVAAAKPGVGGSYRIQVGTVKSADEANALASRLKAESAISGAEVSIDEMAFGGNKFYRVRVGPYASAADTKAPCQALKQGGLDCLVTTQ